MVLGIDRMVLKLANKIIWRGEEQHSLKLPNYYYFNMLNGFTMMRHVQPITKFNHSKKILAGNMNTFS